MSFTAYGMTINRTFAGADRKKYDKGVKENCISERGLEHEGNQLQQAGRLFFTGFESAGRTGSTHWKVRITPPELPEGTPLRDVHKLADAGKTE